MAYRIAASQFEKLVRTTYHRPDYRWLEGEVWGYTDLYSFDPTLSPSPARQVAEFGRWVRGEAPSPQFPPFSPLVEDLVERGLLPPGPCAIEVAW